MYIIHAKVRIITRKNKNATRRRRTASDSSPSTIITDLDPKPCATSPKPQSNPIRNLRASQSETSEQTNRQSAPSVRETSAFRCIDPNLKADKTSLHALIPTYPCSQVLT